VAAAAEIKLPVNNAGPAPVSEEAASGEPRRRGRRGGRRERGERAPAEVQIGIDEASAQAVPAVSIADPSADATTETASPEITQPMPVEPVAAMVAPVDESSLAPEVRFEPLPEIAASAASPTAAPVEAAAVTPAPTDVAEVATAEVSEAPAVATSPVAAASEAVTEATPVAPAPAASVPAASVAVPIDIEKVLEKSGLVMIETTSEKMQAWQPEVSETRPAPRRRKPPVVVVDEPLVMVETQNRPQ
jgi:ribonuclease E